jgi:DNA-binding GntR family transcriptional regulator
MKTRNKGKNYLSDTLFSSLLNRIVSGKYPPGEKISEKDLCQEFGISRTPFREAIRKLEEMRMVEVVPRYGTYVTDIDIYEIAAAYEVRLYMESVAAKLAAERRTDAELNIVKRLLDEAINLRKGMGWSQKRILDQRFHEIIWKASKNNILAKTLSDLKLTCMRVNTSLFADSVSEEEAVSFLESVFFRMKERDQDGLEALMRDHMLAAVEHIKNQIFSKFATSDQG